MAALARLSAEGTSMTLARKVQLSVMLGCMAGCGQSSETRSSVVTDAPSPTAAPVRAGEDNKWVPSHPADGPPRARPVQPPDDMVYVPGGTFDMGPPRSVTQGKPQERVTVSAFFLDRTEVTVAAYLSCVRDNGCTLPEHQSGCNATRKGPLLLHPMNCVTKAQADQYCSAYGKRLPTAAEWEFAARGSDGRIYPWGNQDAGEQLCWQGRAGASSKKTCPVGSFPQGASPFAALDMAGNVAEWTSAPETETAAPGAFRARGGGYPLQPIDRSSPETWMIRADQWETFSAQEADPRLGFRCVKELEL